MLARVKPYAFLFLLGAESTFSYACFLCAQKSVRESVGLYSDNAFGGSLGSIPKTVAITICVHYVCRKGVEAISLLTFSWNVFRSHFTNVWTVVDFMTIAFTLIAISWSEGNPGEYRNGFNAFVVGLLWLKILGYLKAMNKHMATFIMSVSQILSDLKYFAIVLIVVVCQMGDMMR